MYIGGSIFLIVLGAILRYAVADSFDSVDLPMVGLILMIGGAIGLVVSLFQQVLWRDRAADRAVDPDRRPV